MLALPFRVSMPDIQPKHFKKLDFSIKLSQFVHRLVKTKENVNFDYFSLIWDWTSACDRMDAQLTCNVIFPPQANKYQVSLNSQNILINPHPANLCGLGWSKTWTIPISGQSLIMTLDLDHPIFHWLQKVRRHYKVRGATDMDNLYFEACGNLMEKKTV